MNVDLTEAQRFLELIDPEAESWRFRTIVGGKARKYGGGLEQVADRLALDNGNGGGVYVVVNEGGDKAEEITRIRAVFAEWDPPQTAPMPAVLPLEPHIIVESSRGKHHAYWLVDGLPVGEFKATQQAIIAATGSDPAVCDPSRVMRLPGFIHRKPADPAKGHDGQPFQTRIIHEGGGLPYTADAIRAAFPQARKGRRKATRGDAGATLGAGGRNSALTRVAGSLRRMGLSPEAMGAALQVTNAERCDPPLDPGEVATIAASIGRKEPHHDAASDDAEGAHEKCSHLANAHRIATHYGDRLLFVDGIGWHTWGPPWQLDELGARRAVHGLGRIIASEAADLASWVAAAPDVAERERREAIMKARFKWASSSENAMNIEASLGMARSLLACKASDMDAMPDLLGLPSGVLDLATGEHRDHRQADRLTRVAGCDYDPDATCPTWTTFMGEIMGDDPALIDYMQRLMGYALSGRRGEHLLPIFYGSGANGKSTLLAAMQRVLGDYSGTAAPGLLIAKGGNEHPTGLADLQGRRLVVASETGEAGRLNEEQVKALTGGDRITARRMRMDFYQFDPSHLLFMQTNHKPRVSGTDEGIWRRLRLIPFTVTIPPARRDARLPDKLQMELAGILSWAVQGWQKYQSEGFATPEAVTVATREYRDASDQIGAFVDEVCEVDDHLTVPAGELYRAYTTWCDEAGERPRTQREFGMRLTERGFESGKGTKGTRRWRGLAVAGSVPCGGVGGASGGTFGLTLTRDASRSVHTETSATSATRATHADAYRAARDGQ